MGICFRNVANLQPISQMCFFLFYTIKSGSKEREQEEKVCFMEPAQATPYGGRLLVYIFEDSNKCTFSHWLANSTHTESSPSFRGVNLTHLKHHPFHVPAWKQIWVLVWDHDLQQNKETGNCLYLPAPLYRVISSQLWLWTWVITPGERFLSLISEVNDWEGHLTCRRYLFTHTNIFLHPTSG